MKFKNLVLLMCLFLCPNIIFVQNLSNFQNIYADNNLSVDLDFNLGSDLQDCKRNFFKYRVKGVAYPSNKYLIWKINFVNCFGEDYFKEFSFQIGNVKFSAQNFMVYEDLSYFFNSYQFNNSNIEVRISDFNNPTEGKIVSKFSKTPDSISGNSSIKFNDRLTLAVSGGVLGFNSKWVWYLDICGDYRKKIGEGNSITFIPETNSIVYVRSESPGIFSDCISKSIFVDLKSEKPNQIIGPNIVCEGENVSLKIFGGKLGAKADWVWYKLPLNSSLNSSPIKIGTGEVFNFKADMSATYMVRAEGLANFTDFIKFDLPVSPIFKDQFTGAIDNSNPCEGSEIVLKVITNDSLLSSNNWQWTNSAGNVIGFGTNLKHRVGLNDKHFKLTPNFYCLGNSGKNESLVSLNVKPLLSSPDEIVSLPTQVIRGNPLTLTVRPNPTLLNNENSFWFKGGCIASNVIGFGTNLKIEKIKKQEMFSFQASDACSTTKCISKNITPIKPIVPNQNNFLVLAGAEFRKIVDFNEGLKVKDTYFQVNGVGPNLNFEFQKRFNPFSIRLNSGFFVGASLLTNYYMDAINPYADVIDQTGNYYGLDYGIDFSFLIFSVNYEREIIRNNFNGNFGFVPNQNFFKNKSITLNNLDKSEKLGLGLKIFQGQGSKRIDARFVLYQFETLNFFRDFNFDNYTPGFSLSYLSKSSNSLASGFKVLYSLPKNNDIISNRNSNFVISIFFGK